VSSWFDPSVLAASASAIAAIAAAVATWRGPLAAARMAETLRQKSADAHETKRVKHNILGTLMQERAEISTEDAVRALNLIDLAFFDSLEVRESWAELHLTLCASPYLGHVVEERLRKLLRSMADDLGFSNKLRQDDFGRIYFPNAILEERNVRHLERTAALARLKGTSAPAANVAEVNDQSAKWPPKP
jgi:hypothetical protein